MALKLILMRINMEGYKSDKSTDHFITAIFLFSLARELPNEQEAVYYL